MDNYTYREKSLSDIGLVQFEDETTGLVGLKNEDEYQEEADYLDYDEEEDYDTYIDEAIDDVLQESGLSWKDVLWNKLIKIYNSGKLEKMVVDITCSEYNKQNYRISGGECPISYKVFIGIFNDEDTDYQDIDDSFYLEDDPDTELIKFSIVGSLQTSDGSHYDEDTEYYENVELYVDKEKFDSFLQESGCKKKVKIKRTRKEPVNEEAEIVKYNKNYDIISQKKDVDFMGRYGYSYIIRIYNGGKSEYKIFVGDNGAVMYSKLGHDNNKNPNIDTQDKKLLDDILFELKLEKLIDQLEEEHELLINSIVRDYGLRSRTIANMIFQIKETKTNPDDITNEQIEKEIISVLNNKELMDEFIDDAYYGQYENYSNDPIYKELKKYMNTIKEETENKDLFGKSYKPEQEDWRQPIMNRLKRETGLSISTIKNVMEVFNPDDEEYERYVFDFFKNKNDIRDYIRDLKSDIELSGNDLDMSEERQAVSELEKYVNNITKTLGESYSEIPSAIKRDVEGVVNVFFVPLHGEKGVYASISIENDNGEVLTSFDATNNILNNLVSITYRGEFSKVDNLSDSLFDALIELFDHQKFNFESSVDEIIYKIKEIIK